MHNIVEDSMFYKIIAWKTSKEAWDRIKEKYQGSNRTRKM